jgi:hypothetical protein
MLHRLDIRSFITHIYSCNPVIFTWLKKKICNPLQNNYLKFDCIVSFTVLFFGTWISYETVYVTRQVNKEAKLKLYEVMTATKLLREVKRFKKNGHCRIFVCVFKTRKCSTHI